MIKILLIRHALTNAAGKYLSGRAPGLKLNEEGRRQTEALAARLSRMPVTALYSSPLERAIETAAPLAKTFNVPCRTSDDFLEIDFGNWTNCAIDELRGDRIFERFNNFRSNTRIPGGELAAEAQLRIIKGIEKLHALHANETVAIVSHADMIKLAVAHYAGIPADMLLRIEISPASLSIIEVNEETARILLLNDTGMVG